MRQHVNPLSRFFQRPNELPPLAELFENVDLPIHLDIGCARGKFLQDMALNEAKWNFLGLEIRKSLVDAAERERILLELKNLRFLFCNANISLGGWLSKLKKYKLQRVSIQFPDPWFKKRHSKRRVLQPSLLSELSSNMDTGSELFIQTDVLSIMKEMLDLIENCNCFDSDQNDKELTHIASPFVFSTEREKYVIKQGLPIYRKLYFRNSNNSPLFLK